MSKSETTASFQIQIGHRAVWVNAATGECIGRFGIFGVDVHRTASEQHLGKCLDCTHGRVTASDWQRFVTSMLHYHGVDIAGMAVPEFAK